MIHSEQTPDAIPLESTTDQEFEQSEFHEAVATPLEDIENIGTTFESNVFDPDARARELGLDPRDPEVAEAVSGYEYLSQKIATAMSALKQHAGQVMGMATLGGAIAMGVQQSSFNEQGIDSLAEAVVAYQRGELPTVPHDELVANMERANSKDLTVEDTPNGSRAKEQEFTPSNREATEVASAKAELLSHIGSSAYMERLTIELGGNREEALRQQQLRMENVSEAEIVFLSPEEMERRFGVGNPKNTRTLGISPAGAKSKIYLSLGLEPLQLHELARHELQHKGTKMSIGIPDNTIDVLKDSYRTFKNKNDEAPEDLNKYFRVPSERLVRKQQVDFEMERLGIKKYGEKFTSEHHKKLMDAYQKGGVTRNVKEFIETTNPQDFERIFNTIAAAEEEPSVDTTSVG